MKRILSIILISISAFSCSQKSHSSELEDNFHETEIQDLQRLTSFFQDQMCGSNDKFKPCLDSLIPHLVESGYQAILENIDFEEQQALYASFKTDLFSEIWEYSKVKNIQENKYYKLIAFKIDGKYASFLKDLAKRNLELEEYYDRMMESGDWESLGLLQQRIYTNPDHYDLKDPAIQVLIAVHFLTQNDQQKRKEAWRED